MMYQSNNNKVQPWFVQKSDFQMSGSPPAVSEACADEEGGGHTPYQAAAAHQAAPAAHTSYLFCEEPKKSGIMILLHTIRESLKEHRTEATMAGFSSPKSAWSDWKEIKVKLSGARSPPSSISGAPLWLVAESRSLPGLTGGSISRELACSQISEKQRKSMWVPSDRNHCRFCADEVFQL